MLLRAVCQFPPGEHHAVVTGITLQANISAQAHNRPLKPATGVHLAQSHTITEVQFLHHGGIISHDIIF